MSLFEIEIVFSFFFLRRYEVRRENASLSERGCSKDWKRREELVRRERKVDLDAARIREGRC